MSGRARLSTGVPGLDEHLGGGLLPGTLTVVVGASGIGKTQLGVQFAQAGCLQEGDAGILFDCSARIDPQSHAEYAERMFGRAVVPHPSDRFVPETCFDADRPVGNYLHAFQMTGRRVTQADMNFDAWHEWQAELAARLEVSIDFFYSNFVRGVRRAVIDGIEPAARPSESIQFELVEYVYQQILRKPSDWVARDLFRQAFRANQAAIDAHAYDHQDVGAVLLLTAHESLLDDLVARPLADGDPLAVANTLIYMGKIREGQKFSRGLVIAKHRGSACSDEIISYRIEAGGLRLN
jgi:KaiC/GvpD/RAD55 family RecA-like ATPase